MKRRLSSMSLPTPLAKSLRSRMWTLSIPLHRRQVTYACGKKCRHVPGEEEYASVAEDKAPCRAFGCFDVHQHVFNTPAMGKSGSAVPRYQISLVEVFGIAEVWAHRQVERIEPSLRKNSDFSSRVKFLSTGPLTRKTPRGHDGFACTLADGNHQHLCYRFHQHLHLRITVACHVLDAGAQLIAVVYPDNRAIITDPKEDFSPPTLLAKATSSRTNEVEEIPCTPTWDLHLLRNLRTAGCPDCSASYIILLAVQWHGWTS